MSLTFLIIFISSYVLLWAVDLILLRSNFNRKVNLDYSFRRYFTFESHNFISSSNIYLRILYIALSIAGTIPYIYFAAISDITHTLDAYVLISGAFLLVSIIFKIMLYFTKMIDIKRFIITYVVRFFTIASSIASLALGIILSLSTQIGTFFGREWILIVFVTIFFLLFLTTISCLSSSKFYNWYVLEKDDKDNVVRPDTVILALYEWIFNFVEIIFVCLASVFLFLI